jgi:hypothetical protein
VEVKRGHHVASVKSTSPLKNLAGPVAIAILALVLWETPVVFPLKIFVVFLHELCHGLAALLTGGSVIRIELSVEEGGLCVTRGGWRFLILTAGYLGSMTLGAFLLVLGSRSHRDRAILGVVGGITMAVTLLWVRSTFGLLFGAAAGGVMMLVAWKLPDRVSDALLKILGVVSCLYAVRDIASDVLLRDIPGSDANALAELTMIPAAVWGVAWVAASLVVAGVALAKSAKGPRPV